MYIHMSAPPISYGGRRERNCLKNNYWCNNFIEQTVVPTRTKRSLFVSAFTKHSGYTKVSCGARQSALICIPRFRRVVAGNGYYQKLFHIQSTCSSGGLCSGQCRVCRCLGWDEEGEEQEEEEKDECLPICEVGGEAQDILNFLIEDSCRRDRVFNRRELPKSSRVGRSLEGKSFYAERTISGRVWMDRSCCAEKPDVGKRSEHLGSECRWSRFVGDGAEKRTVQKQGSSRNSLTGEKGMYCKSGSKASLTGWRSRIEWISSLELEKEEETVRWGTDRTGSGESMNQLRSSMRWASGIGSHKKETMQKGNERTGVEKSWNESKNNNVAWGHAVEIQKQEETVQEGTEKLGSHIGVGYSSVQFQDIVHKVNQKTDSKSLLSDQRSNVQWSSTVESTKPEKVAQESTNKSDFKGFSNDSSNTRQVSIQDQEELISFEKGESSGAGLSLDEDPSDQIDQMVQNERGQSVSRVPSDNSRKITGWSSVTKLEERERVKITNEKLVFQQQDELHTGEKLEKMSVKNGGKLIPGMPSDDSRKITRLSSATKMVGHETIGKTTERLAFQKQHELVKNYGRSFSAGLGEGKSLAEENVETASKRFSTLIASNRTSQKFSKESFNSGSNEFSSPVTAQEKKTSTVGYEKGNGASQKLFKTSSYRPVCSETSDSVTDKNQSARIIEQANRNFERLSQTSSCKTEANIPNPSGNYEMGSKIPRQMSNDPSYKLSNNEILQMATESNKKKYASEIETDTPSGKSAQARLSNESDYSFGMASAEGTENHGSTGKTSDESPMKLCNPQLSSGDFPSEGPSEEVWAITGWSSREEFDELQSSGKEKLEKDAKTLASEEPSDKLQKNTGQHPIFEVEEGKVATLEKNGKVVVKRRSRGIWSSFVEICSRGWGLHEESDNSTLKSGSGRPSTESPNSEEWFSVPELEDQECILKDKRKLAAKRQANVLISDAGENTSVGLKEAEKTQKEKVHKSAGKWVSEASLDESQLTRRRVSSTVNRGHECQEQEKEEITDIITDSKKTQDSQQGKLQNAAINQSTEGTSADEIPLSSGCVSSGSYAERDRLERKKGKTAHVDKDDLDEHEDTDKQIQRSEIEEKRKVTKQIKRNKQVPKETFISWEEALILESEQRREDETFMREALSEARMAADAWEVPVGAVLVQNGRIIARAHNLVEETRDATAHAEMLCIRYASNQLRTWRLAESTLYVTLEPCAMCAGAILQARIGTVVWGAPNKLLGADGSWVSLFPNQDKEMLRGTNEEPPTAGPVHPFHPHIKLRRGVLASDCSDMMQQFFKLRRKKEKKTQSNSRFTLTNVPSKMFTKLHEIFSVFCL